MSQAIQRQYFTVADKAGLEALLRQSNSRIAIYFGLTTEEYPYTDHGCFVESVGEGLYSYTLEGHGIGSNPKPPADLKNTVRRVFSDCQSFRGGDTVTVEIIQKHSKGSS